MQVSRLTLSGNLDGETIAVSAEQKRMAAFKIKSRQTSHASDFVMRSFLDKYKTVDVTNFHREHGADVQAILDDDNIDEEDAMKRLFAMQQEQVSMGLDSTRSSEFIHDFMAIVEDESVRADDFLDLCWFFFTTTNNILELNERLSSIVADRVARTVTATSSTLALRSRLSPLTFANTKVSVNVAQRIFENPGWFWSHDRKAYWEFVKHMLKNISLLPPDTKEKIDNHMMGVYEEDATPRIEKGIIADAFLLLGSVTRGEEMLASLRASDTSSKLAGIFEDSENVHSCIGVEMRIANRLIELCEDAEKLSPIHEIKERLVMRFPVFEKQIDNILARIETDTSVFRFQQKDIIRNITLFDTLLCLWHFIERHDKTLMLERRLVEEFEEMDVYCSTGYLARLVNVVQGFSEDPKLIFVMPVKEQIKVRAKQIMEPIARDHSGSIREMKKHVLGAILDRIDFFEQEFGDEFKEEYSVVDESENVLCCVLGCVREYLDDDSIRFDTVF